MHESLALSVRQFCRNLVLTTVCGIAMPPGRGGFLVRLHSDRTGEGSAPQIARPAPQIANPAQTGQHSVARETRREHVRELHPLAHRSQPQSSLSPSVLLRIWSASTVRVSRSLVPAVLISLSRACR